MDKDIIEIEIIEKFNPYHDSKGRFTSAGSEISFTFAPGKSKAHDKAIATEKVKNNPYRHLSTKEIDRKMNDVYSQMRRAANSTKYKKLQAEFKQLDQAYSYVQRYGNN